MMNNYICNFCKSPCIKGDLIYDKVYGKRASWQHCLACHITYIISSNGKKKFIKFECNVVYDDKIYQISIDYAYKTTTIEYLERQPEKHFICKKLLEIDYCVNNITLDNFLEKLKTYLLFL